MTLVYATIWGAVALFGVSAVAGLVWAISRGQMDDFAAGARSIFDDDEPIGVVTDAFPGVSDRDPGGGREER
jgi:nitrogen fixation-related uncharacterized protein